MYEFIFSLIVVMIGVAIYDFRVATPRIRKLERENAILKMKISALYAFDEDE